MFGTILMFEEYLKVGDKTSMFCVTMDTLE